MIWIGAYKNDTQCPTSVQNILNITNFQESRNKTHNKLSFHFNKNGYYQEDKMGGGMTQ